MSSIEQEIQENGYIVYNNVGKSMWPLIRQYKDILVITKPPKKCKKHDVVLYKIKDRLVLHRIIKVNKNDYVICGDYCYAKEYGIQDKNIIGILNTIKRGNKTINMESKKMRAYANCVCALYPLRVIYLGSLRGLSKIKKSFFHKKTNS